MGLVGEGAIVSNDEGDQLLGHDLREGGEVEPPTTGAAPLGAAGGGAGSGAGGAASPAAAKDIAAAVIHHDDERSGLVRGNQVVHDQVRAPLATPPGLVLARAVLQVEDRITIAGVLVVLGRRVDEAAARGASALREVQGLAELAVRDVLDGVEILILGRDLDAAAPAAGAEEELAAGVGHLGAVNVDPVVMEALVQGACGADPGAVFAFRQSDAAPFGHLQVLGLRRDDAETRAAFRIDLGVLLAQLVGRCWLEVLHRRGLVRLARRLRGLRQRELAGQQ